MKEDRRLKEMTALTLEVENYVDESKNYQRGCEILFRNANFHTEKIALWMFIACDKNGKVLEEPEGWGYDPDIPNLPKTEDEYNEMLGIFQQAQARVIFEGFGLRSRKTIGSMSKQKHGILCTEDSKYYIDFEKGNFWSVDYGMSMGEISTIENFIRFNPTLTQSKYDELFK